MATPLLSIRDLCVSYGNISAVRGISIDVEEGQIVTLIGANGAGKSTTLRAISGLVKQTTGSIKLRDTELTTLAPHSIVEAGIAHVPEGRGIFANLTVHENLRLATYCRKDRDKIPDDEERVFSMFPRLKERLWQLGGTLSGGEQQMLAVARALMMRGVIMLLDEPSMGLSPILVQEIFKTIREINEDGTTVLLVEQNANMALKTASYGYVLQTGEIALHGPSEELADDPAVRAAYLGG
jgi:branched-chain amino acid transport system ATP-binding protein